MRRWFKCAHTSWASYPLVIELLQDITAKIKIWIFVLYKWQSHNSHKTKISLSS